MVKLSCIEFYKNKRFSNLLLRKIKLLNPPEHSLAHSVQMRNNKRKIKVRFLNLDNDNTNIKYLIAVCIILHFPHLTRLVYLSWVVSDCGFQIAVNENQYYNNTKLI